jgi:hypothetical protein
MLLELFWWDEGYLLGVLANPLASPESATGRTIRPVTVTSLPRIETSRTRQRITLLWTYALMDRASVGHHSLRSLRLESD